MNEAFCSEEEVHVGRLIEGNRRYVKAAYTHAIDHQRRCKLKASNLKINEN